MLPQLYVLCRDCGCFSSHRAGAQHGHRHCAEGHNILERLLGRPGSSGRPSGRNSCPDSQHSTRQRGACWRRQHSRHSMEHQQLVGWLCH